MWFYDYHYLPHWPLTTTSLILYFCCVHVLIRRKTSTSWWVLLLDLPCQIQLPVFPGFLSVVRLCSSYFRLSISPQVWGLWSRGSFGATKCPEAHTVTGRIRQDLCISCKKRRLSPMWSFYFSVISCCLALTWVVQCFIGDTILLWRLYVVWNKKIFICLFPVCWYLFLNIIVRLTFFLQASLVLAFGGELFYYNMLMSVISDGHL